MNDKCEHRTCHCPPRADSEYCSEFCKNAADDFTEGCHCGHQDCHENKATTTTQKQAND